MKQGLLEDPYLTVIVEKKRLKKFLCSVSEVTGINLS